MPDTWEIFVGNWATDHGIPLSEAVVNLSGTEAWMRARRLHAGGGDEGLVRALLNIARGEHGKKIYGIDGTDKG